MHPLKSNMRECDLYCDIFADVVLSLDIAAVVFWAFTTSRYHMYTSVLFVVC